MRRMAEIRVGKQGRVVIPADLREEIGLQPGDKLSAQVEDGRLVLEPRAEALTRVQRRFRHASGDRKLVDELIAERRAAAAREGRES
jgi:AbrB family looped-hinge helix DNA binding protein